MAGPRDALFFPHGWYPPVFVWNWHARFMREVVGEVRLPLAPGREYRLTLRMDPFVHDPERPQQVAVSFNGSLLRSFTLSWDPQRTGEYQLTVPARLVRDGANRLELRARDTAPADGLPDRPAAIPEGWRAALELRYILVEPAASGG
jgi:hypothetical protein